MIEPELQNYLSGINQNLTEIKNKKQPGIWRAFFNGMFSAFGYFVGLAVIVSILGFIAQKTGALKNFQDQVTQFQELMNRTKTLMGPGDTQPTTKQQGNIITLPDGRQVKVVPAN